MQVPHSTPLQPITGIPHIKDAYIVIVKTEWNSHITNALEQDCIVTLQANGIQHIYQYTVPGAFELSFAINSIVKTATHNIHAVIAFGCVIKGDTPHFEYVCHSVTHGITELNLKLNVPTIYGVLTVLNEQQAQDRINGTVGYKGAEAAVTAIKMLPYVAL